MTNRTIVGAGAAMLLAKQTAFAAAFQQQRQRQFDDDRNDVLRRMNLEDWQRFSLRWNLPPPFPDGWGNEDAQYAVMHKIRLMLTGFSAEEKKFSAAWLVGHGVALPEGLTYEDGELKGMAHGPGPIRR